MQGGYDGTHFLANVEVYDPANDLWEDGIPLTSGRSGLASAVIYQPSCHQSYSQDCIANQSANREYDDERKPPDQDDDTDISSRGPGSSFHLNCSSNFFSARSGGQYDKSENITECEEFRKRLSTDLFHVMTEMKSKLKEYCSESEMSEEKKLQLQQEFSESHVVKLANHHLKCSKHSSCPLQILKRRFRHFIFSKTRNSSEAQKLCKKKGM